MSADDAADRGILSSFDRRKPGVRVAMILVHALLILGLVVAGLGPLLWLAKAAVTPTQDSISTPMLLWPNGVDWANITAAWVEVEVGKYFVNTLVLAAGALGFALLLATTGGYVLSVLRPRYAPVLNAAVLATLFIPSVVLLV
ncbi:MAG: carbohydrate ABC transporter permease, partial [Pseudolysinimonas sp.]